jgi:purine-binding chemotaxis protein CheW
MPQSSDVRLFCTFNVDTFRLGIPVEGVQEVLGNAPVTMVPLADPCVRGVVHLRGQVLVAIDLRRRLGLPPCSKPDTLANVIVHTRLGVVSLLVDAVEDVLQVDEATFEECPSTVAGAAGKFIRGAYKLGDGLLLSIDCDQIADLTNPSIVQLEWSPCV